MVQGIAMSLLGLALLAVGAHSLQTENATRYQRTSPSCMCKHVHDEEKCSPDLNGKAHYYDLDSENCCKLSTSGFSFTYTKADHTMCLKDVRSGIGKCCRTSYGENVMGFEVSKVVKTRVNVKDDWSKPQFKIFDITLARDYDGKTMLDGKDEAYLAVFKRLDRGKLGKTMGSDCKTTTECRICEGDGLDKKDSFDEDCVLTKPKVVKVCCCRKDIKATEKVVDRCLKVEGAPDKSKTDWEPSHPDSITHKWQQWVVPEGLKWRRGALENKQIVEEILTEPEPPSNGKLESYLSGKLDPELKNTELQEEQFDWTLADEWKRHCEEKQVDSVKAYYYTETIPFTKNCTRRHQEDCVLERAYTMYRRHEVKGCSRVKWSRVCKAGEALYRRQPKPAKPGICYEREFCPIDHEKCTCNTECE